MKLPIDEAALDALPDVRWLREGQALRFLIRGHGASIVVVEKEGAVELFPERSSGHRALAAALRAP